MMFFTSFKNDFENENINLSIWKFDFENGEKEELYAERNEKMEMNKYKNGMYAT